MLNKTILKIVGVCSGIIGAIIGFFALFPFLELTAFLVEMFCVAPFIIIYLKKLNILTDLNIEKSLLLGAVSGASSFLGFALVFLPISFLLNLIFKLETFIWVKVLMFNLGFVIPMIIFTALLSALLNMFSAFLLMYFFIYFKKNK